MIRVHYNKVDMEEFPGMVEEQRFRDIIGSIFYLRDFEDYQEFVVADAYDDMAGDFANEFYRSPEEYETLKDIAIVGLRALQEKHEAYYDDVAYSSEGKRRELLLHQEKKLIEKLQRDLDRYATDLGFVVAGILAPPTQRNGSRKLPPQLSIDFDHSALPDMPDVAAYRYVQTEIYRELYVQDFNDYQNFVHIKNLNDIAKGIIKGWDLHDDGREAFMDMALACLSQVKGEQQAGYKDFFVTLGKTPKDIEKGALTLINSLNRSFLLCSSLMAQSAIAWHEKPIRKENLKLDKPPQP